ncbi:MAG: glycosyltransferase family 4 protein [Acidobacteriota bacterium]
MPSIVYIAPSSGLYGGIRIIFEHAQGLARRGWDALVVGPDPPPDWHTFDVAYEQRPIFEPGGVPTADLCVGTFYTTIAPAAASGAEHVFHLCQGFEGVHREYAPILHEIDAAYARPIPKVLISAHLQPVLEERYGATCYVLGQSVPTEIFTPGPFDDSPAVLRVAVVGPFGLRPKGIAEALDGLGRARAAGHPLEIHRASSLPLSPEERALGQTDVYRERLSTSEMVAFYQGVDALVHPSHDEEGFPLPPLEAMACGAPVALTAIRPFAVLPDAAVVRFPPATPEALVEVVAQLRDPATRRRLHAAGLAEAQARSLDAVLDRLEEAFAAEGAPTSSRAVAG